ncbi:MAG TPA: tetratricopeptide repeat protein [Candidatus Sulfotelmatobacter sp.]
MPEVQEQKASPQRLSRVRLYVRQRPVMLVLLTALTVAFFVFVAALSRAYKDQQTALGNRWFERGIADMSGKRYQAAVKDFRAALLYSRDNYTYQLNLAEALLGMNRRAEASAYLLNLWDRQPEDGLVNLELARIAAQKGQMQQAVRYYHDAVYAVWPSQQERQRREVRLELIGLLLQSNAKGQAQAELIGLSENADEDPVQLSLLGDLFMRADDYEHALAEYRSSLKADAHNAKTLAGAGYAAYELQQYSLAEHYLQDAIKRDPNDKDSAERLKTTEMVLRMDPYQRQISQSERVRLVIEAFTTAGERLQRCAVPSGDGAGRGVVQGGTLSDEWSALKPQITQRGLQRNAGLADEAMDLVFRIERQTSVNCGAPSGPDLALLLISKLREGNRF